MNLDQTHKEAGSIIKPLTSIRFILVLMVFLSHLALVNPFFLHYVFQEGAVAVEFFFILSGFIITYTYKDKLLKNEISKKQFWFRRIARIYPLHLLMLFIFACFCRNFSTGTFDWIKHFSANLLLIQAYIPRMDYFFSFNGPSWSLACEQLFYLLFPYLIIWKCKSRTLFYFLIILVILTPIGMYWTQHNTDISLTWMWYVNPLSRLADFIIGIFLYHIFDRYRSIKISYQRASLYECGAVFIFCCFFLLSLFVPSVYHNSCWYWIPISMILLSLSFEQGCISLLLSNKYLIILGEMSFAFYMIHFFFIRVYAILVSRFHFDIPIVLGISSIFIASLIMSYISNKYFEKPMNQFILKKNDKIRF